MIIDLGDCKIDAQPDIDPDLVYTLNYIIPFPHLTTEEWVELWATDAPEGNTSESLSVCHCNTY